MKVHHVSIAFKILEENESFLLNYKRVTGYVILDMNVDFIHKHRWLLHGHTTPLKGSTHANVLPRKSLKMLFKHEQKTDKSY